MDSKIDRKEAIKEYKARKTPRGVYAIRCAATGQAWVGSSRNLEAARNSNWFALRIGSHRDAPLQALWNAQGESAFQYEILETLDDDVAPLALNDLLKEKKSHWVAQSNARPLL